MAQQNGTNAASFNAVPQVKIPPGEQGGKLRVMYETFVIPSVTPPTNDLVNIGAPLPPGARIIDFKFIYPAWGGSATVDIGWLANDIDVANPVGFWSALSVSSAGKQTLSIDVPTAAGMGMKFNVGSTGPKTATQLSMKIHAAGSATSGTNIFIVTYITE